MGELEQALQALMTFFGGSGPVSMGPSSAANLQAAGISGAGSAAPNIVQRLSGSGIGLDQIFQIISALGGANIGTDQLNQLKQLYAQQQNAASIAMNPALLARRAAHATLPINKELAYTVNSAADAGSANAGMAEAPGAVASARAAALAPIAQQNIQTGAQMSEFGLPTGGVGAPYVPDYMSVLRELNQFGQGTGGGAYSLPQGTF